MKRILYIIGALVLAGCSKELPDEPKTTAKPGEQVAVTFGASVSGEASQMSAMQGTDTPASRAFTSAYTGRIAVLDNSNSWVTDCDNISLAITSDGVVTTNPAQVVLTAGEQYSFHSVAVPNGKTLPAQADNYALTSGKVADGTDLIYAKVNAIAINGGEQITFNYNHVYGKVKFVLKKGANVTDEQLAAATLQVSGYYGLGSLDLKTGTITGTANTDVSVEKDTEYFALPQTFAQGSEATAKVTIDGKIYSGKITVGNITPGVLTTVTITVNVEKAIDTYVGMFAGTMIGDGTETNPYRFSKKLYVSLTNEVEGSTIIWRWAITKASHSSLAGSKTDGRANTWNLNKGSGGSLTDFPAANRCFKKNNTTEQASKDALTWYLPAWEQLMGIWITHTGSRASFDDSYYYSSSERDANFSWYVNFNDGRAEHTSKTNTHRVRCVREGVSPP